MINWQLIGCYNRPPEWEQDGADGVFGDVDAIEQSCNTGEQGLIYLMRLSQQQENLSRFTGVTGDAAREPTGLEALEPEDEPMLDASEE